MDNVFSFANAGSAKSECRKSDRQPEFSAGLLARDGGAVTLNCFIRNMSPDGAQIRAEASKAIPQEAYLINLKSERAHLARLVWRHGSLMGLKLESEYSFANGLPQEMSYLRRLLMQAKLEQVDRLLIQGKSMTDALQSVHMTHKDYVTWNAKLDRSTLAPISTTPVNVDAPDLNLT